MLSFFPESSTCSWVLTQPFVCIKASYHRILYFSGHCRNAKQLQCEIIPYLALTDVPLRSPSKIVFTAVVLIVELLSRILERQPVIINIVRISRYYMQSIGE